MRSSCHGAGGSRAELCLTGVQLDHRQVLLCGCYWGKASFPLHSGRSLATVVTCALPSSSHSYTWVMSRTETHTWLTSGDFSKGDLRRPWAARGNPAHLHKDSQKTGRPGHRALHATLGWKNHTKPWFKSTLLLFLRLLLSTKKKKKKRWPAKPFFFFFQEKQATENGILQIYKHREGSAHTWVAWFWGRHKLLPRQDGAPLS